ncbi:TPA: ATP-binding protein, partial [Clostridioides difficile]
MLDMFITIVSSIIEIWACKKVFDYTSKAKTSLINLYFLISAFVIISTFYTNINADNRILICIFVMLVFYKLNYEVNLYKCLIVSFFYWAILVCINALSMIIIVSINNLSTMNILLNDNFYRYETIVLGNVVLIVLLYIYRFISNDLSISKRELYMCIPIVANMISFFIFYKYILKLLDISSTTRLDILIMVLLLTFSNIALISSLVKILKSNKKYIELTKLQEKINAENKYYSNIKKYYIKTKELNHDMKNHL